MSETIKLPSSKVKVTVKTDYLPLQSLENENQFVYSYTITITNNTHENLKLLTRHWIITDANGDASTVSGEGVVGEQPIIASGNSHTYTSGSIFKTPVGTMQGHYTMLTPSNKIVEVEIPVFRLAKPNILN